MNQIAFIFGETTVYWSSLVIAAAILTAILAAVSIRLWRKEPMLPLLLFIPLALVLSILCARFIHWYCRADQYSSFSAAFREFTGGGYALLGVFVGCFAAALLVRALRLTDDLPSLLDSIAPAAALGISLGRLSHLFDSVSRGKILIEKEVNRRLPLGSPVVNPTNGTTQWRFATFFFQSILAFVIFILLLILTVRMLRLAREKKKDSRGMTFLLFLMMYFSTQIILDSTRYDALFLRSNGFVSLEQIFGIVVIVAVAVIFSIRSVKLCEFRVWHAVIWALMLGCFGGTGYMEYYVQRHGSLYLMCYGIMSACLLAAGLLAYRLCLTGICGVRKKKRGLYQR